MSNTEGPLAWITVNFLLGTIFDSNTNKPAGAAATGGGGSVSPRPVAILDMGGASTQIVFVPNGNPGALRGPAASEHKYTVTVFGKTFDVYQHSHLGYGLKEAGKSIAALATDPAAFECFPPGFQMPAAGGVTVCNAKRQPQSYDKCQRYARKFIKKEASCAAATCSFNGVYQPPLARDFAGGDFFIFSYFYDRMIPFLPEDGVMTVGDYKRIGRKICDSSQLASSPPAVNTDSTSSKKLDAEAAARNLGTECMDFAYLYELLATGYELPDSQVVNIRKKVKGFETAWTLGAMIIAMQ